MRRSLPLLLLGMFVLVPPGAARAELVYGLTTSNSLVSFESFAPGVVSGPIAITGLVGGVGEEAVGIDFRPSTPGVLVALTRQQDGSGIGTGRLYTVDTTTGAATLINTLTTLLTAPGAFDYGVDFNPAANAFRIVNNADQNLRITAGGTGTTNSDTALNPGGNFIDSIAYSRNNPGMPPTTLYGIAVGPEPDELVTIGGINGVPSPNTGMVFTVATLGPPDPAFLGNNGFDISGSTGIAYAAFRPGVLDPDSLFTVDLITGVTTSLGAIGVDPGTLRDISIINAVPEPGSLALLGVGAVGLLGYARKRRK